MADRMCTWSKPGVLALAIALGTGTALAQMGGQNQSQPPAQNPNSPASPNSMNSQQNMANMSSMNNGTMPHSQQDSMFLKAAAQGSNYEIKAGHLAEKQSSSADVKQFGRMMVKDHTKLNMSMMPVAKDAGMTLPTGLSADDKAEYDKLKGLQGQAFDQEYIQNMIMDHKKDLQAFQQEVSDGQMQPEKQAAQKGESVVQMHLDKIQQIAQAHNISASGM